MMYRWTSLSLAKIALLSNKIAYGKIPHAALEARVLSRMVSEVFAVVLRSRVPKAKQIDAKMIHHEGTLAPRAITIEPKGCQSEPRDLPKHPMGNRIEKTKKGLFAPDVFSLL